MDAITTVLVIALALFALTGFLTIIGIICLLFIVKDGAFLTFGYKQDDDPEDE